MPIFEYRCPDCGKTFMEWTAGQREKDEVQCPRCGSERSERMMSTFATKTSDSPPSSCSPRILR